MSARRGRPPIAPGEKTQAVSFRVPVPAYDRLTERASRERTPLASLMRRAVDRLLDDEDRDDDD